MTQAVGQQPTRRDRDVVRGAVDVQPDVDELLAHAAAVRAVARTESASATARRARVIARWRR